MSKAVRSYGLWSSPVTPALLGQRLRLDNPQFDRDGRTLVWLEGRSDRSVLVARPAGEAALDLTDEQPVRAQIGYGGGDYTVANGLVIFASPGQPGERGSPIHPGERGSPSHPGERGGRLFRRSLDVDRPRPITPANGYPASPALSADGRWVAYVWSDGTTDLMALVDAEGQDWPVKLSVGADFYMQPAWHPSSQMLAWVEWDHPNMPWDETRVKLARLSGSPPRVVEEQVIACGPDCAMQQPQFSPDGRWLSFIAGNGEWEDLVLYDLSTAERVCLVRGDGFQISTPAWGQGLRHYGWNGSGRSIYYLRNAAGLSSLWRVDLETRVSVQLDSGSYMLLKDISVSPTAEEVVCQASAPNIPTRIVRLGESGARIEARGGSETLSADYLAMPVSITWPAPDGMLVYALYYAPTHPIYTGEGAGNPSGAGLPPAILNVHGGPTGQASLSFSGEAAYFTTRGYAYVELNYRGSSGYGSTYRNRLRQHWGEVDVEDALGCARALVDQGLADSRRLVIKGGSAGGFTLLNALARHPGVFKAGICLFGVTSLFKMAMDISKFEERYLDSLVGPLPEAADRYRAWSPIFHAGSIRDPLAIFQGKEDQVVPLDQAEDLVKVLRQNGVPHIYRLYEGEGHGWRKTETIVDYFQQTERFLKEQVLFS